MFELARAFGTLSTDLAARAGVDRHDWLLFLTRDAGPRPAGSAHDRASSAAGVCRAPTHTPAPHQGRPGLGGSSSRSGSGGKPAAAAAHTTDPPDHLTPGRPPGESNLPGSTIGKPARREPRSGLDRRGALPRVDCDSPDLSRAPPSPTGAATRRSAGPGWRTVRSTPTTTSGPGGASVRRAQCRSMHGLLSRDPHGIRLRAVVETSVTAEELARLPFDFDRYVAAEPRLRSARWLDGDVPRVGARAEVQAEIPYAVPLVRATLGAPTALVTITQWDPPFALAVTFLGTGYRGDARVALARGPTGCRVEITGVVRARHRAASALLLPLTPLLENRASQALHRGITRAVSYLEVDRSVVGEPSEAPATRRRS